MKKPLDRITEAYFDQMGTPFGEKVRDRIHWICQSALGDTILDVGCSQGIVSILLGREGKQVLGIDLLEESIEYANNKLSNEAVVTKKYVEFKTANFIDYDFNGQKFDSIILGEILEHVSDPKRFIKKAAELLEDNGQIIITVPFGINDYFDHKKTYYLHELLDFQVDNLEMKNVKFFGKWIGTIFSKNNSFDKGEESVALDSNLLKSLEDSFYQNERILVDDLKAKKNQLKDFKALKQDNKEKENKLLRNSIKLENFISQNNNLNLKSNKAQAEILSLKAELQNKEEQLNYEKVKLQEKNSSIEDLKRSLNSVTEQNQYLYSNKKEIEEKMNSVTDELREKDREVNEKIDEKDKKIKELSQELETYRQEFKKWKDKADRNFKYFKKNKEKVLEKNQELFNVRKEKINSDELLLEAYNKEERLLKSYAQLLNRYEALKSSKLGKVTISYWKWRRKRFGGKSRGYKINKSTAKNYK